MKKAIVLVGVGEMGGVFARGFLKAGHPVFPVARGVNLSDTVEQAPDPQAVVVAVGEKDLQGILKEAPGPWRDRLVLLQNELLPRDWQGQGIKNPTVISAWFEKKAGQDVKVIIPSPVFGPRAGLVKAALEAVDIPCRVLNDAEELLFELVLKNLYILTVNIAGLEVGGNVGELWEQNQNLARAVAGDILDIQFKLIGKELDRHNLIEGMVNAFKGDWTHKCMGRSAPARLQRAVEQAGGFGLRVERLRRILGKA